MANSKTEEKNVYSVLEYCLDASQCRRSAVAKHFDEVWDEEQCEGMCDHCKRKKEVFAYDVTSFCRDVFTLIDNANEKGTNLTLIKLLDALFQTGAKDLRVPSVKKPSINRDQAENVIAFLLLKGFLKEEKNYTAYTVNCYLQKKMGELDGRTIEMPSTDVMSFKRLNKRSAEEVGTSKKLKCS